MPLHQTIQNLLLIGVRLQHAPAPAPTRPPPALQALVDALEPERHASNGRAVEYGHRYRSAFWGLYLLSALAVLFAALPEGLGWADERHALHRWAPLAGCAELAAIGVVAALYVWGHRRDWQGRWLAARTEAELLVYLPLAATLQDPEVDAAGFADAWLATLAGRGNASSQAGEVDALCRRHAALATAGRDAALRDPAAWARWLRGVVAAQQDYHARVALRQHALQHRVHRVNALLFALTALGTAAHLVWHQPWLLLVATVFPALGAALHGALAQSEAYRLEMNSRRLAEALTALQAEVGAVDAAAADAPDALRALGHKALDTILAEHHDWYQLVQPHRLPLG
ncbi:MAG: hypothetical protein JO224_04560 [Pelomonas sp.]|nr:hypothetical protein [Roseateles sp.]